MPTDNGNERNVPDVPTACIQNGAGTGISDRDRAHASDHRYMHEHGIPHSHVHTHEHTKAVPDRLSRAIGHLKYVRKMVEEGRDCPEVLIQIAAVRSAIDRTGKLILQDHLKHCIVEAAEEGDQQAIDDLCQAIDKYMK